MNRSKVFEASQKALAAADGAVIAASFANIKPERANHYADQAEAALYAALDALAMARLSIAKPSEWAALSHRTELEIAA